MTYTDRVIKQIEQLYLRADDVISWPSVEEDFFNHLSRSEMMKKYGFNKFQYKILKQHITGEK